MALPTKPAIVLVHGIWHSPVTYVACISALQGAGYDVIAPFLPSCVGASSPLCKASDDIRIVRRAVEILADQGRSVIMLLHSYGGVVGSDAIEGLDEKSRAASGKPGGVVHIVGLAAHLHPQGFAILDIVREFNDEYLIPVAFDITDDGTCMSANPQAALFGGMTSDKSNEYTLTLSRAPWDIMEAKVQFEAWKHIPVTYVHTTEDVTFPPHYQQRVLEKLRNGGCALEVIELPTGHSPYITNTEDVVNVIEQVTSKIKCK